MPPDVTVHRDGPRLLFINGFHRSGTTLLASAVTEAVGGVTTTVGALARHIPTVQEFLERHPDDTADRGADKLQVTSQTAEEYGFLLHYETGQRALYGDSAGVSLLRRHVAELAADAPNATIVLKNPWDVGHEARMLAGHPNARIIVVRRRLADIEQSVGRALVRTRASDYARALEGGDPGHDRFEGHIDSAWKRALLLQAYRLGLRRRVYGLIAGVRRLPADRVAVLSYDELRTDAEAGAAWAAHLLDPDALARSIEQHVFAEQTSFAPSSAVHRALDWRWKRTWEAVRTAQARAGIVAPPSGARSRVS